MSEEFFLVRHGNTFEPGEEPVQIGEKTDLRLSAFGRAQAEELAEYFLLKKLSFGALFSGRLKRQREFAEILGEKLSLSPLIEPSLNEIDYGPWEGLSQKQIETKWPQESEEWREKGLWPPFFGSSESQKRQALFLWMQKAILQNPSPDPFLAVTSGGILRLLYPKKVSTAHFCHVLFDKRGLSVLAWGEKALKGRCER